MGKERSLVVDLGAGDNPHPDADVGVDIREDAQIQYTGVDLGVDEWPFDDNSVNRIYSADFLEHVPRDNLDHLWKELSRVLEPGGLASFTTPLAGGFRAQSSPTHRGPGGFNPKMERAFNDAEWSHFPLTASAWAEMMAFRIVTFRVDSGPYAAQLIKIPGMEGHVHLELRHTDRTDSY